MSLYGIIGFFSLYMGVKTINSFKPKRKPVTFESTEQEDYVKRYIEHTRKELHKPVLGREPYMGASGQN